MIDFVVHSDEYSKKDTTNVACFSMLKRSNTESVTGITYFPKLKNTTHELERFSSLMQSLGFETEYSKDENDNLIYYIDTRKPREIFEGNVPKGWILINLMIARYVEEESQLVTYFLDLIDRFPNEGSWFLFYVAHQFGKIINSNHTIMEPNYAFKPLQQCLAFWKGTGEWNNNCSRIPTISTNFVGQGLASQFIELRRSFFPYQVNYNTSEQFSSYRTALRLPTTHEKAKELLEVVKSLM